ncbi:efflux RND transporter periplasmic adaptor subunit [Thiocapsa sp.]|uniref:efflux RND transporter periplasmic adaptor subunit n=1 Tax=Thiocapsa sp. TaxID=2024551 RepID=UPI00359344D1
MTRESTVSAEPIGLPSDSDRAAPPPRRLLRVALTALVLLGLAAGTSVWLTSRPENGATFETAEVERGDLRIKVTATGSLQPVNQVDVGTEVSGTIVRVAIDEADVGQVVVGQSAEFVFDAYPDRRFPATIAQVRFAPETVSGVVTYAALLDLDNSDLALRPGMTATAEILVQASDDVVLVPTAALRFNPPQDAVPKRGASNLLGMLMPRPPPTAKRSRAPEERSGREAHVWISTDGEPTRVSVKVGPSDGIMT